MHESAETAFKTTETAWCPGCGDFAILEALRGALEDQRLQPHQVLVVGGIGQAAKTPQYLNTNGFNGLHGRALPPAVAAKMVNPALTVIVSTGDGDTYGEGGNHFIHNIRRNVDITHFVHDNQIYGLTKGQASPTSATGHTTHAQPLGSPSEPMNPLLVALALGAGFVARGFSGDREQLRFLMGEAMRYRGYALLDILQPCVSFNKINTFAWYKSRVYRLGGDYDPTNYEAALQKAQEWGLRIPLGILYRQEKALWNDHLPHMAEGPALVDRHTDPKVIQRMLDRLL
nr:thiamine pyrophosphate-dependent enzyme [uncultured Holophaga sp.]